MEVRQIKVEGKVNKKRAKRFEKKDKEMIAKAVDVDETIHANLELAVKAMPVLVGVGLLSEDEAVEVSLGIKKALTVFEKRNTATTVARIADLCAARVAEMIGGEVVEGGEENAEG
jgi:hypothetical protein